MNIFYFTKYEYEHSLQRKITPDKVKKRQSFVGHQFIWVGQKKSSILYFKACSFITHVNTNPLCFCVVIKFP